MTAFARQVCLNHPLREAVAICKECARSFCRECIAEHDDRLICASCLQKLTRAAVKPARRWPRALGALVKSIVGFVLAWLCFYSVGRSLVQMPSTFHEDFLNSTWNQLQRAVEDE